MSGSVYLDYAAATPVDPRVVTAMQPYFSVTFYNPSSSYMAAKAVRAEVQSARARLAAWLGTKPAEIIITAGATESANLAVHGIMQAYPLGRVAVCATEHASVLEVARQFQHDIIAVDSVGVVSEDGLKAAIKDDTVLVAIGYANGMLGTLQSLGRIGQIIADIRRQRLSVGNQMPIYFYSDASQAAAYCDMHVSRLGVDLLTLSAPKIFGPKQVGLLFVKAGIRLEPLLWGGGQESGVRSGTENVAGMIGFAAAAELVQSQRGERLLQVTQLRDLFEQALVQALGKQCIITASKQRVAHISHVSFPGIDAETLLFMLDEQGVMIATGAACAANKQTASSVLLAIGMDQLSRQGSIRCSFSHLVTKAEVAYAAKCIISCVQALTKQQGLE